MVRLSTFCLSVLLGTAGLVSASRKVEVALNTAWRDHHLLLEILEQTALHSLESPLPLLHALAQHDDFPAALASSPALLDLTRSLLPAFIPADAIPLWDLGLAARETAPRVEAFLKLHDELASESEAGCDAWVEWDGRRACGEDGLLEVLRNGEVDWTKPTESTVSVKTHAFDHAPLSIATHPPLVVYFDATAAGRLGPFLAQLRSFEDLPVLLRYRAPADVAAAHQGVTPLAGWGVEMVLKKMEYSSVDDRARKAGDAGRAVEDEAAGATGYQSLFFEEQLGPVSWELNKVPLTEEQLDLLPLQSFPLILNHSDPIAALEHLSQNFPLYSSAFANMDFKADTKSGLSPVNEGRYRELWRNRQIWSSLRGGRGVTWQGMRGDGREGRVWIGAKEIAETEMGLFHLLPLLRDALNQTSILVAQGNTPAEAQAAIKGPLRNSRQVHYDVFSSEASSFNVGNPETALVHIDVILNPLTETAQKWSTMLRVLSSLDQVYLRVLLLPSLQANELPLKRFYRYNMQARLDTTSAPTLEFLNLPEEPIFTLGIDVPSSWLVRPRRSIHDLDNLRLSDLASDVKPVFELENLLIEGHAREGRTRTPPKGLQVQLEDHHGDLISDTIVMANLGYFQLRSTPGVYAFRIREGRGQEVYELESLGLTGREEMPLAETGSDLALYSFQGLTIFPRFDRRKGMEEADVLDTSVSFTRAIAGWLRSKWNDVTSSGPVIPPPKKQADINIFTVASGLLYERFASIMTLSVMKHTNATVKFWFIEDFLSPSFLEFIPHLAKEHGFEYELITYKWPSWLNGQKEKQRLIWAYKILFLDVLFPMDLDKVIFVDADQIVRTDLKALVDEDLEGAPYGYAPMGDDKEEMEGFRFWKTGYWLQALRGRPYHISALYVVDLKRLRQTATGDMLRGQYQGLSQDPNSLANLDQDLPNSMQDYIPIHTLDKSWLWCATWCSQESLGQAKTIDLCQDPLTKEPKLARARKIPEWEVYDAEVAALAERLASARTIEIGLVSSDDLAKVAAMDGAGIESAGGEEQEVVAGDRQQQRRMRAEGI